MNPALVVISDLDGTLLDQLTYSYDASLPAVRKLQSLNIPLVLCSSKTHSEMGPLWEELGLNDPFIVENGGAIYFPTNYFPFPIEDTRHVRGLEKFELGQRIDVLRRVLVDAARQLRIQVRSFGDMTLAEICRLTGLSQESARAAADREYDEPFVVEESDCQRLFTALRAKGLKITTGDRFFHLTCGSDKGRAAKLLLDWYRRWNPSVRSAGLGNSPNDVPFLLEVDHPVLIRNPDGTWDSVVVQKVSRLQRTLKIGPEGWREAVEEILERQGQV